MKRYLWVALFAVGSCGDGVVIAPEDFLLFPDASESPTGGAEDAGASPDAAVTNDPPDAASGVATHPEAECDKDDVHRYACCVFDAVNQFRHENDVGLKDYLWDAEISAAAFFYANYMAERGRFAHGLDGLKVGSRLSAFGVEWSAAGENIQRNTYDTWQEGCESTLNGWATSTSGHREAMLDDRYTHAAVGVDQGNDGYWYVVMNFAKLR